MKRFFFLLATLFALCFSWTGCSDGGDDTNGSTGNGNGGGSSSALSLSKNELEFDSNDGYQTIKVTSSGEWEVTGGSDWCDISPSKGKTGETVTISVEANTTDEDRTVTYTFKCGSQTAKLTVLQYGIIETSYVDLKIDDENTSVGYNELTGETVIEYKSGAVPDAEIGQAFVLSGEHDYDIRKITGVTQSNGKLTLQTEQGTMCDLFKNISFTLTTNPDMVATSRSAGRVITPTSIEIVRGNKRSVIFDKKALTSREVYEQPIKIFDFRQDLSGVSLFMKDDGVSGEFKWETWKANIGLDAVFHFDFGEKVSNKTKIGELKNFKYYLQGNVDVDMLLALEAKAEAFAFSVPEEKQTVKKDILPVISVKFMAGAVPVVITLETDLKREGEISCGGSIQTSAGFNFHADAKLGMEYDVRTHEAQLIKEFNSQFELYQPTFDIKAFLEASAGYYPHLQFHFYKFIGPYLNIKPLYTTTTQAHPIDEMNAFIWDAKFGTKITGELGLELDWVLDETKLKFYDENLKETTLFEAPASIKLESPEQGHQIEIGEEVEVCFHVQSLNYLTNDLYDCPGVLVSFNTAEDNPKTSEDDQEEGRGDRRSVVSKQWVVSDSKGRVKVKWAPTKENEYLIAKIESLNEETETAEFKPQIKDERRILLEMIYQQTNGENWTHNDNWLSERPINEWSGVYVEEESGKIFVDLYNNNLTGTLKLDMSDESLKPLSNILKGIGLNGNQLSKIELIGHESLESIGCNDNPLETLDISGSTALKELNIECEWGHTSSLTYLYAAACTSLERINCSRNKLKTLFLNGCTVLKELNCEDNEFKELDLSGLPQLEYLHCIGNPLETLNVSKCVALKELDFHASYDQEPTLTKLNVSECSSLTNLNCRSNKISTLLIDECPSLTELDCSYNKLSTLDLSGNKSLKHLSCIYNPFEKVNLSNCTALVGFYYGNDQFDDFTDDLKELDLSGCTSLKEIEIETVYIAGASVRLHYKLEKVDIQGCTALERIHIACTKLKELNLSGLKSLKKLNCISNLVTELQISGLNSLKEIDCSGNELTTLSISNCSSLEEIECACNQISNLNISGCNSLKKLCCQYNKISSEIPNWFSQLESFNYDKRYTNYYWDDNDILHYTDNGVGWWNPGEPSIGYHAGFWRDHWHEIN